MLFVLTLRILNLVADPTPPLPMSFVSKHENNYIFKALRNINTEKVNAELVFYFILYLKLYFSTLFGCVEE